VILLISRFAGCLDAKDIGFAKLLALTLDNRLNVLLAIFGAAFYREMKDIHNKFDYLAKLFNDVVKTEPTISSGTPKENTYHQREHLLACLSHDILIMNMWAHKSFKFLFKETLEKTVIYDRLRTHGEASSVLVISDLEKIADNGVSYSEARRLISDYLEYLRPKCDRPDHLFDNYNKL
jgi:hypothetical protein